MVKNTADSISLWFHDAEYFGEYIGIRFGHVPPGGGEVEWIYLRHTDYDGIGAFAELLRRRGGRLDRLPQLRYPLNSSGMHLLRSLPKYSKTPNPVKLVAMDRGPLVMDAVPQPPPAVAWGVFDEAKTAQIRWLCRTAGVTVNSYLLRHLTKAIRPSLEDQSSIVPWMVPVNLRGKVARDRDTANTTSFIDVRVTSYETVQDVHGNIYRALARGEHWANWHALNLGAWLPDRVRRMLIRAGRVPREWHLGAFSNLGDWDADRRLCQIKCQGTWLFCPPVLRNQLIGAGCVTFQNRLSLAIQTHPDLTTSSEVPQRWIEEWVREIEFDLRCVEEETAALSCCAA